MRTERAMLGSRTSPVGSRTSPIGGIQAAASRGPRPPRLPPPTNIPGAPRLAGTSTARTSAARPALPAAAVVQPASAGTSSSSSPAGSDLSPEDVYIGIVKTQSRRDPTKYFIECRELRRLFDNDVKMEASEKPHDVQLGDLVVFMVARTHGKFNPTPVACHVKRVDYDVASVHIEFAQEGEADVQWEAEDENGGGEVDQVSDSPSAPPIYRGLVRNQSKKDLSKYFIECPEAYGQYNCDVKLLSIEKPSNVDVGDTIEFIVMEVDVGAPLAVNVTRVPVARQQFSGNPVQAASAPTISAPRVIGAPPGPLAKRPRVDSGLRATSRSAGPRHVPAIRPAVRAS